MAPNRKSSGISPQTANGTVDNSETPFRRMLMDMAAVATAEEENSTFNGDTLAAIYNAVTDEEIWDADMAGPLNAQHLAGCELALYELSVKYSRGGDRDIQTPWVTPDGKKMYVLVSAARISRAGEKKILNLPAVGERFEFNTSAQFLTAKLFTFWTRGRFGNGETMNAGIQATDLGDGKSVIKLVRITERTVVIPQNSGYVAGNLETEPPF